MVYNYIIGVFCFLVFLCGFLVVVGEVDFLGCIIIFKVMGYIGNYEECNQSIKYSEGGVDEEYSMVILSGFV